MKKEEDGNKKHMGQTTNSRMTDSIIPIIILKGNSINIPLKKNQSLQRLSKIANVRTFLRGPVAKTLSFQGRVAGLNP